ncbi:MAG: Helix-turn-helix domain protein [Syntrophorhabdaceae bacterium PtaU1.Bin034]|nr:MAG: Helix-turn-helix domain protein [Syntrophorhabdaceae bacterium PtaU1.Bin034]
MEDDLRLLTIVDVTKLLRISKATLHKLIGKGKLIPTKIGGRTLFTRKEVERFIEQQTGAEMEGKKRGRKPAKPKGEQG